MNGLQSGERKAQFFEPCGIDFGCMFHRSMHIGARGGRFFDSFDTFSALRQKSRGTPAMQEKNKKAPGACGDSLSPRFTGLKNMFISGRGVRLRQAYAETGH